MQESLIENIKKNGITLILFKDPRTGHKSYTFTLLVISSMLLISAIILQLVNKEIKTDLVLSFFVSMLTSYTTQRVFKKDDIVNSK